MTDFLTREQRSARMARIRSSNTTPERAVRSALHREGLRFRLHVKNLPGHPDIVLRKYRAVIFVHGCFWHRHSGCPVATTPKSNTEFWKAKFDANVQRDARVQRALRKMGWRVFVVWECQVASGRRASLAGSRLARRVRD